MFLESELTFLVRMPISSGHSLPGNSTTDKAERQVLASFMSLSLTKMEKNASLMLFFVFKSHLCQMLLFSLNYWEGISKRWNRTYRVDNGVLEQDGGEVSFLELVLLVHNFKHDGVDKFDLNFS